MSRDNNPHTANSNDSGDARDNMPSTHKHGGRSTRGGTEACPSCGAFDRTTRQVPRKNDAPITADVCDECGYVFADDGPEFADKA
jgi:DNA-directed RNA polymerase subunit M/transcription elongation factor TFIIS